MKQLITIVLLLAATVLPLKAESVIPANDTKITYIGRAVSSDDGSVSFDWSGVTAKVSFKGRSLSLAFSEDGESHYNVWIDKVPSSKEDFVLVLKGEGEITIAGKLPRGDHWVVLQKRTEGEYGKSSFRSFRTDGSFIQAQGHKDRHIEFVGDSYTCGYGTEGPDRNAPFLLETENCNLTYAAIAGRYFDADVTLVSHSGRGIVRAYDGKPNRAASMVSKYPLAFDGHGDSRWDPSFVPYRPDIVVIYLGTNDFSTGLQPSMSSWCESYARLLREIRDFYGDRIPILCVASKADERMGDYVEEAVRRSGVPNVSWTSIQAGAHNDTSDLGSSWHPNYSGQRKVASCVIPYIATLTGWDMPFKAYE